MENMKRSKLEIRLAELEMVSPITNDKELMEALKSIIEETVPENEADVMMIDEAVEMLLELENVNMAELGKITSEIGEKYIRKRRINTAEKKRRTVKLKWIIPVAAMLSFLCITIVVSSSAGLDAWSLPKNVYTALKEKVEYLIGGSSVIKTSNNNKYESLDDMIAKEDLSGVLLPKNLSDEYTIEKLLYDNFDEFKSITMVIFKDGYRIGVVHIKTDYNADYDENKLVEVEGYRVYETHYDDVFQFEFDCGENHYLVKANSREDLVNVISSLTDAE